jgi:hypothetical protein
MPRLASLLIVLAVATTADARPKSRAKDAAKVHMDNAAKAHKAGKFDVALEELKAAYELDPQPKLVYAIAQVYAKLDHCERAIEHYEQFIAATKDKTKQAVVRQAIDACKRRLADPSNKPDERESSVFRDKRPPEDQRPTTGAPAAGEAAADAPRAVHASAVETRPDPLPGETKPAATKPAEPAREIAPFDEPPIAQPPPAITGGPATGAAASPGSPWYRDALGGALVLSGVGATVASVFVYRAAQSELDGAEAATTLAEYQDHRETAERKQLYTFALAGGGVALVTAGVLRYALGARGREARGLALVPNRDGGLVTWTGGF